MGNCMFCPTSSSSRSGRSRGSTTARGGSSGSSASSSSSSCFFVFLRSVYHDEPPSSPDLQLDGGDDDRTKTAQQQRHKEKSFESPFIEDLPGDVLASISACLDRTSLNNFELTCKTIHHVINNPKQFVAGKPWPTNKIRFFDDAQQRRPRPAAPAHHHQQKQTQQPKPDTIVFSNDGSRVAIYFRGIAGGDRNGNNCMQVWDRSKGLLGSLLQQKQQQQQHGSSSSSSSSAKYYLTFKPIFSPDNSILVCDPSSLAHNNDASDGGGDSGSTWGGILICHLNRRRKDKDSDRSLLLLSTTYHSLDGTPVASIAFLNNDSICVMGRFQQANGLLKLCHILRDDNNNFIGITDLQAIHTMMPNKAPSGPCSIAMDTSKLACGRHRSIRGRLSSGCYSGGWETSGRVAATTIAAGKVPDMVSLVAFVWDTNDRDINLWYYNSRRSGGEGVQDDEATTRKVIIPDGCSQINDMAFSHDGRYLIVAHRRGGLSLYYDCCCCISQRNRRTNARDVAVSETPYPAVIRHIQLPDESSYQFVSFAPQNQCHHDYRSNDTAAEKVAVRFSPAPTRQSLLTAISSTSRSFITKASVKFTPASKYSDSRIRIIDLDKEQIISDGWDDDGNGGSSSWQMLVS